MELTIDRILELVTLATYRRHTSLRKLKAMLKIEELEQSEPICDICGYEIVKYCAC